MFYKCYNRSILLYHNFLQSGNAWIISLWHLLINVCRSRVRSSPSPWCSGLEGTWTIENSLALSYIAKEGLICWSRSLVRLDFWVQTSWNTKPRGSLCASRAKMVPHWNLTSSTIAIMTVDSCIVFPMHKMFF